MKKKFRKLWPAWRGLGCLFAFLILGTTPTEAQVKIKIDGIDNLVYAQKNEEQVDTPVMECLYECVTTDTVKDQTRQAIVMLQVGKAWTNCVNYKNYWTDSLLWTTDWKMTVADYKRHGKEPATGDFAERLLRNLTTNEIEVQTSIGLEHCVYRDAGARFDWTLEDGTETVCGYTCRKATAHFRGRTWTAWYAEELAADAGPWKLNGLPGLILRAETADGAIAFEAIQVRRPGAYYIARQFKEPRDREVTREDALKLEYQVKVNSQDYMASMGIKIKGNAKAAERMKRLFYVPFELE